MKIPKQPASSFSNEGTIKKHGSSDAVSSGITSDPIHFPSQGQAAESKLLRLAYSSRLGIPDSSNGKSFRILIDNVIDVLENQFLVNYKEPIIRDCYRYERRKNLVKREPNEYETVLEELKAKRDFLVSDINNIEQFFQEHNKLNEFQEQLRTRIAKTKLCVDSEIKKEQIIFISREDLSVITLLCGRNIYSLEQAFDGKPYFDGVAMDLTDEHGKTKRFAFVLNDLSEVHTAFVALHETSHLGQPLEALQSYKEGDAFAISIIEGLQLDKEIDLMYEILSGRSKFSRDLKEQLVRVFNSTNEVLAKIFGVSTVLNDTDGLKSYIRRYRLKQIGSSYELDNEFTQILKTLIEPHIVDSVHSEGTDKFKAVIGNDRYEALKYLFINIRNFCMEEEKMASDCKSFFIKPMLEEIRNTIGKCILENKDNSPAIVEKISNIMKELKGNLENVIDIYASCSDEKSFSTCLRESTNLQPEDLLKQISIITKKHIDGKIDASTMEHQLSSLFAGT